MSNWISILIHQPSSFWQTLALFGRIWEPQKFIWLSYFDAMTLLSIVMMISSKLVDYQYLLLSTFFYLNWFNLLILLINLILGSVPLSCFILVQDLSHQVLALFLRQVHFNHSYSHFILLFYNYRILFHRFWTHLTYSRLQKLYFLLFIQVTHHSKKFWKFGHVSCSLLSNYLVKSNYFASSTCKPFPNNLWAMHKPLDLSMIGTHIFLYNFCLHLLIIATF